MSGCHPPGAWGPVSRGATGSGGSSSRVAAFSLLALSTAWFQSSWASRDAQPVHLWHPVPRDGRAEPRDTHAQHFPPHHTISWLKNAVWPPSIGGDLQGLCRS